jgi:tetratricopeptide (TPR) repeat protein
MLEMLRVIRERVPSKPSTKLSTAEGLPTLAANRGTEPAKLTKIVCGELDWIVMKALEKDRSRRYETANGLAMDVQRYLADEPVLACPPSAGYRLRKFGRRHRGPLIAASLVLLALVGGVIGTTLGLIRAERALWREEQQRLRAEANAERAARAQERAEQGCDKATEAVEKYLQTVTDDPDLKDKHDLHGLRKKLLDAAVPFYEWFAEQKPGEAEWEGRRGKAYYRLALVRSELGEKEAAVKDYERMRVIFDKLVEDFPTAPRYRELLADSYSRLGKELYELHQYPAAKQAHCRALAIREKLVSDFPGEPRYRSQLAGSHNNVGFLARRLGEGPTAQRAYDQAIKIQEELAGDFPGVVDFRLNLATILVYLGSLLKELEQAGRAPLIAQGLGAQALAPAGVPLGPMAQVIAASKVAILDAFSLAEQAYRRAIDIWEKLLAEDTWKPEYREGLVPQPA